jgi:hypothetical protein
MSGYTKPCIFCKQEIRLSNDSGKWLPYNLDNTVHECKKSNHSQQQPKQLTLEDLDSRLQKLEEKISEVFGKE